MCFGLWIGEKSNSSRGLNNDGERVLLMMLDGTEKVIKERRTGPEPQGADTRKCV
jgi:hypothetical protein